ncbi:hypothetical protein [Roseobacter sinensis]|uniref:Uncharacterized protein n=1 Tax=Roseobacter sinensis TaxID=2931391 RepID=A0ABT3BL41_9RHOB|nr:hypothetical protein [Roseobacter sp. WL0113]MCV3274288.1 hypothetical protein [Roseobacter sp. WL0113]
MQHDVDLSVFFVVLAVVKTAVDLVNPGSYETPPTLTWTTAAWALLSTSMTMRDIALIRSAGTRGEHCQRRNLNTAERANYSVN